MSLEKRVSLSLAGSFRCFVLFRAHSQTSVSPRVTAPTGDIYRSSLSGLTKALRTWLGRQGRGRWEVPWDADSWGLVWQAFSRTGEVTGNQRRGSLVFRGKRDQSGGASQLNFMTGLVFSCPLLQEGPGKV